ncbi:hypothetical protein [Flectobacillus longus]|uniref:hypothetical protein n=1 Tax=Flectobacillus longus TaxID=2984207 RepID=UPI0024B85916|nr:hypothetical protein [Flectobacillus longus]MDI9879104.1 hypothetical protein [Flectobacillus longus]
MKNYLRLASLLFIFSMNACTDDASNTLPTDTCFKKDPIAELPWLKTVVTQFQQPKSGPLKVVLYVYKSEYYIAVNNPLVSSPGSYIFNCKGESIGKLNISYNQFTADALTEKVLLEGTY